MTRPVGTRSAIDRHTVQIRVSAQEREAFERRAKELGLTVSEWLRTLARHDSGLWCGSGIPGDGHPIDDP